MKKIMCTVLLIATFVVSSFAQDYVVEHEEKDMTLPDGAVATVLFFKKWNDAGKYLQTFDLTDFHVMIGVNAKTEKDLGYLRKSYKENENDSVAALCEIHKEFGAKYSICWLNFGDRVTRCVFTYSGKKLAYDRMDFFKDSNELYKQYIAEKTSK